MKDLLGLLSVASFFDGLPAHSSRRVIWAQRGSVIVWPYYGTDRVTVASVFGLTGQSKRNLINILKQVLLAGGSSERALELRILPVEGGRHRSIPGLRQRLAPDPACFRGGSLAQRGRAART